jgi:hypothetical protein
LVYKVGTPTVEENKIHLNITPNQSKVELKITNYKLINYFSKWKPLGIKTTKHLILVKRIF